MVDEHGGRRGRRGRPSTIDVKPDAPGTVASEGGPAESPPVPAEVAAPAGTPGETVMPASQPAAAAAPEGEPPAAETPAEPLPAAEARPPEVPAAAVPPRAAETPDPVPPVEPVRPKGAASPEPQRPHAEVEPAPPPRAPEPIGLAARKRAEEPRPAPRAGLLPGLVGGLIAAGLVLMLGLAASMLGLFGGGSDREAELRALSERVASIEAERRRLLTAQQALAAIEPRLATVERMATELQRQSAQGADAAPADGSLRGDLNTLREQLTVLETRLAAEPAPANTAERERLTADVARLATAVAAMQQRVAALDVAPLRSELARLGEEVRRLATAPPSALERNAALVIAADALERAVARGEGFAAELAAVKALGVTGVDFSALEARAASGVPSRTALATRLRSSARGMIAAAQPAADGTVGRLMQSVGGLVSVRPIGEPAGEGPAATVARIETKLTRGDLPGALAEFRTLPDPAQAAAGSLGADLAARVAAESLVERIKSDILRGAARGQG